MFSLNENENKMKIKKYSVIAFGRTTEEEESAEVSRERQSHGASSGRSAINSVKHFYKCKTVSFVSFNIFIIVKQCHSFH